MRPKKIIMSAFGPYANVQEINFDKFGTAGIYLITGDTGAGKTTIFDGITYALYGEASGKVRDSGNYFRSKYAESGVPTFVELVFECKEKEYRIKRNPEYERPNKRGEGFTIEKASVELYMPDGQVITKNKDVSTEVKNIIGVDFNQFTQIAMIAQGEFLKLIVASTEDRQKIFREIFGTKYYQILQEKLKNETGKLTRECDILKSGIKQYIDGSTCKENSKFQMQLLNAKDNKMMLEDVIILLDNILEDDMCEKEQKLKEQTKIEDLMNINSTEITKAQENIKIRSSLNSVLEELQNDEKKRINLQKAYEDEKLKEDDRKKLIEDVGLLREKLPKYKELENIKKLGSEKSDLLKNLSTQCDKLINKIENESDLLTKLKKENESLKNVGVEQSKVTQERIDVQGYVERVNALEKEANELVNFQNMYENKQQQYIKARDKVINLENDYMRMNKAYLDEQAGILASTLKEGEKCPVCGSLNHPEKAILTDNAPSKEELEKIKNNLNDEQQKVAKLSEDAKSIGAVVEEKTRNINRVAIEVIGSQGMDNIFEELKNKKEELRKKDKDISEKLTEIENKISRYKKIEKEIPDYEKRILENKEVKENLTSQIAKYNAEIAGIRENYKNVLEGLEYKSEEKVLEVIRNKEKEIDDIKKGIDKAQKNYQLIEENIKEKNGKIAVFKEQLKDAKEVDLEDLNNKRNELDTQKKNIREEIISISNRINVNSNALQGIKNESIQLVEKENKSVWLKSLSNTANGNVSGKEKIMLETYVQMTYFDRIIARANTRFMEMTSGQYELVRRGCAENNKSQSGLDLDIVDHYNGSQRSVKTLSGGESFKASLSLALGLSDEIQSAAGGVKLDTMFVDEGFGSLDEESLRQAIKTLGALTEGNRLIGIISHVGELKEKIDKQIIVRKQDSKGSQVEITY